MVAVRIVAATLMTSVLSTGCVGHRPPPAEPAAQMPNLELPPTPPPNGHGRVILDTTEGSFAVEAVEGHSVGVGVSATHTRLLCQTPCAVDLTFGQHELQFTDGGRRGEAVIDVQGETTVVRTAVGQRTGGGRVAFTGAISTVVGALTAAGGGLAWASESGVGSDSGTEETITYVGLGMLAVGLIMWFADRPSLQQSSSVQWHL